MHPFFEVLYVFRAKVILYQKQWKRFILSFLMSGRNLRQTPRVGLISRQTTVFEIKPIPPVAALQHAIRVGDLGWNRVCALHRMRSGNQA